MDPTFFPNAQPKIHNTPDIILSLCGVFGLGQKKLASFQPHLSVSSDRCTRFGTWTDCSFSNYVQFSNNIFLTAINPMLMPGWANNSSSSFLFGGIRLRFHLFPNVNHVDFNVKVAHLAFFLKEYLHASQIPILIF